MKLKLSPVANDDTGYLQCIENAVSGLVKRYMPEEIFLVRIDAWFGPDYLNYGATAEGGQYRIPPFRRAHIVSDLYFLKNETGKYELTKPRFTLHPAEPDKTGPRLLKDYAESTLFVWFSSNSKVARRGSLMVYVVEENRLATWFALFSKNGRWRVASTEGVRPEAIAAIAKCT